MVTVVEGSCSSYIHTYIIDKDAWAHHYFSILLNSRLVINRGGWTCTHEHDVYTFENISDEPIGYNTKLALMDLKGLTTYLDSTGNKL